MKIRSLVSCVRLSLIVLSACGYAHATERLLLEPEEFDGMQRYPYFNESATGWYAQEGSCRHYGAPGRGYFAMIHAQASERTIGTALAKPLPAGEYKIFITSMGLMWHDMPNVLKVRIGGAESLVSWEKQSGKFIWIEGSQIKLTKPATRVELEVVQFGGKGYGMLYEPRIRSIPVDQIYITSDLSEKTGPSIAGFHVVNAGRDAPAELVSLKGTYRSWDNMSTPQPHSAPVTYSIELKAFDGRRNLVPNSSFELGGGDGWSTANNSQGGQVHIFCEADHVKGEAVHGEYALRLPGKGTENGLQFSRAMQLSDDGTYTLSASMRAIKDFGKAHLGLRYIDAKGNVEKTPALIVAADLTDTYQRFTVIGDLKAGTVILTVNGACMLDAVQLEKGDAATAYAPRAEVEASITTDKLGHIMYSDSPVELVAWAHNSGTRKMDAELRYRVLDVRERVIAEETLRIPVGAGQTVRQVVPVQYGRGAFNVVYAAQGRPYAEGELIYSVLPPISKGMPRHALASNMDNDPASLELMQAMGHKWQLYCKLTYDAPNRIHPKPDVYAWDKARSALTLPQSLGMQTMPCLWPNRVPEHMADPALSSWEAFGDGRRDIVRAIKGGRPVKFPDLDKWSQYCEQVARNLGDDAAWWTIEDETELYYTAREFARIVQATAKGFKASGKDMKVSLSCMGDYTEEMIAELGGEVPLSGFGASSYNYEYWEARKARLLQQRYGVPWSCIGVGVASCPQFRRTGPFGEPVYARTVRTAQEMVLLTLVQDAKVIGHYTGRLWYRGALKHADYPLMDYDGTPLVHGFAYSCIPLMLADAVPVEDVYLDDLRTMVFVFRQDGKLHGVTWCNNDPGLDIHWKTDPLLWHGFTLSGADGKVRLADMFGNPRVGVVNDDGNLAVDLGEEPLFIFNDGLSDTAFLDMVRGITADARPLEMRLAFLPDGKGGVDLGVHALNTTQQNLSGLQLDANFPPNRMVSRTDWTLPGRDGKIGDIASKQAKWGRIETTIGLDFPVENATYTAWITDATGREHRMADTCWMTVAPSVTAKVDGRIEEWGDTHPAWMYYTYSWARFGRHVPQLERNGEEFKYVDRVDARAAIFTGYDKNMLYVAIRCEDDDFVFTGANCDEIEISLNEKPGYTEGALTLIVTPKGKTLSLSDKDGNPVEGVQSALVQGEKRTEYGTHTEWVIELGIPLSYVGGPKSTGDAIGFDVVWHDADHEKEGVAVGTWRWAGRSTSLGSLFFGH